MFLHGSVLEVEAGKIMFCSDRVGKKARSIGNILIYNQFFWARVRSLWLAAGSYQVRMKRMASKKLFKYLLGFPEAIFGPPTQQKIKSVDRRSRFWHVRACVTVSEQLLFDSFPQMIQVL